MRETGVEWLGIVRLSSSDRSLAVSVAVPVRGGLGAVPEREWASRREGAVRGSAAAPSPAPAPRERAPREAPAASSFKLLVYIHLEQKPTGFRWNVHGVFYWSHASDGRFRSPLEMYATRHRAWRGASRPRLPGRQPEVVGSPIIHIDDPHTSDTAER